MVETSLVGCVLNGLSHMHDVSNRLEFAVALIRDQLYKIGLPGKSETIFERI